ncbi:MAG: hypothetical protein E7035_04915 [Verrucomicrobiaceae bacterium]|nr:hypothetical protein [Verrucomicrobiaceae bacterium]
MSEFFSVVLCGAIVVETVAYLVASHRHHKGYEKISKTSTFHCLKCNSVYVSREGEKSKACPNCNYRNAELKF